MSLGRVNSFLAAGADTLALTAGLRATTGFTATAGARATAPDIKEVLAERVTAVFAGNAARLVVGIDIKTFKCETVLVCHFLSLTSQKFDEAAGEPIDQFKRFKKSWLDV